MTRKTWTYDKERGPNYLKVGSIKINVKDSEKGRLDELLEDNTPTVKWTTRGYLEHSEEIRKTKEKVKTNRLPH